MTDRQMDSHIDRRSGKNINGQTDRQTDRQKERKIDRLTDRLTDRVGRQTHKLRKNIQPDDCQEGQSVHEIYLSVLPAKAPAR